ncbi:hypothetical protein L1887_04767 [Cichorium endivia]|nr:hypothetical protein L1887_04767 [Cichorium endivia]
MFWYKFCLPMAPSFSIRSVRFRPSISSSSRRITPTLFLSLRSSLHTLHSCNSPTCINFLSLASILHATLPLL